MKKLILLAVFVTCISSFCFGQITLEHTYISVSSEPQPILFTSNGEKYMVMDSLSIYLYNTDHTLWKTIHPATFAGYKMQSVLAISDNLFNSDNLVELIVLYYSSTVRPYYKSQVINENASLVFDLDSAYYPQVHYNSTTGTYKLFAAYPNYTAPYYPYTNVYALPGTMPCGQCSSLGTERIGGSSHGIIISDPVPNPSAGAARISYQLPNGSNQATIYFYNMVGQLILDLPVIPQNNAIDINNSLFKPGNYAYLIRTDNLVSETKTMTVQ